MKLKWLVIFSGLLAIFSLSYCKDKSRVEHSSPYLNHNDSVDYVGIQACASCHADKFATFVNTGMGSSFDVASLNKSSAKFNNVTPVYDAFRDLYYLPLLIDSSIHIKEYRLSGKDTVYSRLEKISYIIGSGHHTNSHFIEENGFVYQAPLTFYTQKGQWDLPPGFENGFNNGFERKIGLECMSCHNASPKLINGSENRYLDLPHGIDCERCHGPGELHVNEKKRGILVDVSKSVDYSIVNPAKLSWQRQIDICQRCHLQGNAVLKPGKDFTDFKPGMELSKIFDQFSPHYIGGDEFVMAAHSERFQMSKCFTSSVKGDIKSNDSKVGFTCISCHNPHVSVRETNLKVFNAKCNSCHSGSGKKSCSDLPESLLKEHNNCVKCHMPSSGTSDIPHVTVHDHYIRKPTDPRKKSTGSLIGLRCITNPKPDLLTETNAYITYFEKFDSNPLYMDSAKAKSARLDADKSENIKTLIHLHYINSEFNKVIQLSSKLKSEIDGWTAYRIAKSFERMSNNPKALEWFDKAIEFQAQNLDFLLQKSYLLIKMKQFSKAKPILENLNKLYSKNAESWACLGLVHMNENQLSLAKNNFEKSLSLNPDLVLAIQNLRTLEQLLGNIEKVKVLDLRLSKIKNNVNSTSKR